MYFTVPGAMLQLKLEATVWYLTTDGGLMGQSQVGTASVGGRQWESKGRGDFQAILGGMN